MVVVEGGAPRTHEPILSGHQPRNLFVGCIWAARMGRHQTKRTYLGIAGWPLIRDAPGAYALALLIPPARYYPFVHHRLPSHLAAAVSSQAVRAQRRCSVDRQFRCVGFRRRVPRERLVPLSPCLWCRCTRSSVCGQLPIRVFWRPCRALHNTGKSQ